MDDVNLNQLILTELREFRAAVTEWQQSTGERVSVLETHDKDLYGNGRAGRVTVVESKVDDLTVWKWRIVGIATGVSTAVTLFGWLLTR
jgi:hypothetical protein